MSKSELTGLAKVFGKLGITAFGGPAAHIAMMRDEIVVKRNWLSEQHFLDLIGATNLIPGPNSTEMAFHIGYERAGLNGLLVAGAAFIFPAVFITACLAFLYKLYGSLPSFQPFIYGISPSVIAIILAALYPLARKSLTSVFAWIIGLTSLLLVLFGVNEIYIMFGAGFISLARWSILQDKDKAVTFFPLFLAEALHNKVIVTNLKLFLIFLKIGAILYGSGYVLFAFLDADLVKNGIISRSQLIDAIAVGQFTPGPVLSSVTFIGYQIGNFEGALVSTFAVFLPSLFFVLAINPFMKKMRESKSFRAFLDAVNISSVAIIAAVCLQLGNQAISDPRTALIAGVNLFIVFKYRKLNSAVLVLASALLGRILLLLPF